MNYKTLFAVTDYFTILTLTVIEQNDLEFATQVVTNIEDNNQQNIEYHNSHYKKLFINKDGELIKNTVFFNYNDAKSFATFHINERLNILNKEQSNLENILDNI